MVVSNKELLYLRNRDWLIDTLDRIPLFWVVLIFLMFNFIINFGSTWIWGRFLSENGQNGLLSEYMMWTSDFLIPPVIISYYLWIQSAPNDVIKYLLKESILVDSKRFRSLLARAVKRFSDRRVSFIALGISILMCISFAISIPIDNANYIGWTSAHPIIPWVRGFASIFTFYAALMFVYDMIVVMHLFFKLLRLPSIRVKPYHIDGSGGFAIIGRFTSNLGFLLAVFGVHISISLFSNTLPFGIDSLGFIYFAKIAGFAAYIILAMIFFVVLIFPGHMAMLKWKQSVIEQVTLKLDQAVTLLEENINNPNRQEMAIKEFIALKEVYNEMIKFPVWPFDMIAVRNYYTIVTTSVVPGIIMVLKTLNSFR